jgi:hypothetical protein
MLARYISGNQKIKYQFDQVVYNIYSKSNNRIFFMKYKNNTTSKDQFMVPK